jgi:hypothetical protein
MRTYSLIYFIIFLTVFSNAQVSKITVDHYQKPEADIAIFPANSSELLPGADRFTPTREDIDKAENALLFSTIGHPRRLQKI